MKNCKACGNLFLNTSRNFKEKTTYRINKNGEKTVYYFLSLYCLRCESEIKYKRKPKEEKIISMTCLKRLGHKNESYFNGDFGELESLKRLLELKEINE